LGGGGQITGDESTYGRDPVLAIPHCQRCRDWGYVDASNGGQGTHHHILEPHLIDAKTRYSFIEKLCLSLFYACCKLRHYLLSTTCVVACQADMIKHMLQQLILSGRIGKWAYALI
jgi:hypothetical protein